MSQSIYDVAVVGTGAGGSTAIRTLCQAGLKVVALNSGIQTIPSKHYRNHRQNYELPYRGLGEPKYRGKMGACEDEVTAQLFEHDITYTTAPGTRWKWSRCKATGGKANFWGRSSARYGDIDFKAGSITGVGEDWPITYAEIAPYYSRIERAIGVSSTVQNRPSNPDGEYLPPFKSRCMDYILKSACDSMHIPYLPDRIAQLTVPHNGHPGCHYCGFCTSGCDVGAFFSPTWFFLPDGQKTGNLELRTNAHVRAVLVNEDGHAKGVAYIDRDSKQEVEVYAKAVVLAASCCETAKIMLNSKSRQWPTGIANSSGQVGRNLVDHLYATSASGFMKRLLGQPSRPDNVSNSTVVWMPRWQNLKDPHEESFVGGYSMYPYGGCDSFPHYHARFEGFGSQLKKQIKRYYPTPVGMLLQAPALPSPENFLDLDPEVKDIFGIPVARFHYEWGPNELKMWEHSKQVCQEIFRRADVEYEWADTEPNSPGHSLHETGTCRFGDDPKRFVTNRWCQTHDVPNLYLADASVFPSPTDKTTTLSIMAFTLRACEHMLESFKNGDLRA